MIVAHAGGLPLEEIAPTLTGVGGGLLLARVWVTVQIKPAGALAMIDGSAPPGRFGRLGDHSELPERSDASARASVELRNEQGIAVVAPPVVNEAGDAALLPVTPTTSPQSQATEDLVDRLREEVQPVRLAGSGLEHGRRPHRGLRRPGGEHGRRACRCSSPRCSDSPSCSC